MQHWKGELKMPWLTVVTTPTTPSRGGLELPNIQTL